MIRPALAMAMVLAGSAAHAERPLVNLEIDACVTAPRDDVRRVVGIELGTLLVDAPDPADLLTRVRVTCEGGILRIRVDDPVTAKSLERTIDLGAAAARAQSRLLALAIVELISASWTELEANPRPRVAAAGPAAPAETRAAALAAVRKQSEPSMLLRTRLMASGGGFGLFAGSGGAALKIGRDHRQRISWAVDVQAQHGNAALSAGEVSTDLQRRRQLLILAAVAARRAASRRRAARWSRSARGPRRATERQFRQPVGWVVRPVWHAQRRDCSDAPTRHRRRGGRRLRGGSRRGPRRHAACGRGGGRLDRLSGRDRCFFVSRFPRSPPLMNFILGGCRELE